MMKGLRFWGFAVLVTLLACGSDDAPAVTAPFTGDLARCDITTQACQRGIFASVAEQLEADPNNVPPIRTISVEQFEEEIRSGVSGDDLSGDDPESRALRLIGFIPDGAGSALEDIIQRRVRTVAAYYSGGNQSITVIDRDYEEVDAQTILAHEFVHAIQDREVGIGAVFSDATTDDGVMGARTVIEGDATYASFAWIYNQLDVALDTIDWDQLYLDFQESSIERAGDPEESIAGTASFFPYAFGIELLGRATQSQGLPGRRAFLDAPPPSALDSMLGYESFVDGGFVPLSEPLQAFPSPTADSELAFENRYGAWYLFATLARSGFHPILAWATAIQWRGDKLGVFESGSEVVAVWRIRLDGNPDFIVDAINESDRPVAWSASSDGGDIYIIAAESDALLAVWEAQPLDVLSAALADVPDVRKSAVGIAPQGCSPPRVTFPD